MNIEEAHTLIREALSIFNKALHTPREGCDIYAFRSVYDNLKNLSDLVVSQDTLDQALMGEFLTMLRKYAVLLCAFGYEKESDQMLVPVYRLIAWHKRILSDGGISDG